MLVDQDCFANGDIGGLFYGAEVGFIAFAADGGYWILARAENGGIQQASHDWGVNIQQAIVADIAIGEFGQRESPPGLFIVKQHEVGSIGRNGRVGKGFALGAPVATGNFFGRDLRGALYLRERELSLTNVDAIGTQLRSRSAAEASNKKRIALAADAIKTVIVVGVNDAVVADIAKVKDSAADPVVFESASTREILGVVPSGFQGE